MPIRASREKTVVFGFAVTDMGEHGEIDRGAIEALGRGGSANPVAVLPAGMLGDGALPPGRAPRISSPHFLRESLHILAISSLRFLRAHTRSIRAGRRIRDASGLGGFEGRLFHQKALAFVATSGSAPFQYDGPKRGCLLGTPGERGISGREKLEVVEVRTGQAQGPFGLIQADPSGASQRRAALAARPVSARNEDLDFRSTDHEARHSTREGLPRPRCLQSRLVSGPPNALPISSGRASAECFIGWLGADRFGATPATEPHARRRQSTRWSFLVDRRIDTVERSPPDAPDRGTLGSFDPTADTLSADAGSSSPAQKVSPQLGGSPP